MTRTCFYVSVLVPEAGDEAYTEQAPQMADMFRSIFMNTEKIAALTSRVKLTDFHTELDVSLTEEGLLGRAVLDIDAEERVNLNKTKLSQLLKAASPWKQIKVEKRLVPVEDSDQASHAVAAHQAGAADL